MQRDRHGDSRSRVLMSDDAYVIMRPDYNTVNKAKKRCLRRCCTAKRSKTDTNITDVDRTRYASVKRPRQPRTRAAEAGTQSSSGNNYSYFRQQRLQLFGRFDNSGT